MPPQDIVAENTRIEDLRKRLEKEPGSRLFAQLAEELRKDGELEEAIRVARSGLETHPTYMSARMTLGRALLDTGDLTHARTEFENVLKGAPDNVLAGRFLGECLEGLGDLGSALLQYRAILRLVPGGDRTIEGQIRALEERLGSATSPVRPPAAAGPPPPAAPATLLTPATGSPRPTAAAAAPAPAPPAPTQPLRREPVRAPAPPLAGAGTSPALPAGGRAKPAASPPGGRETPGPPAPADTNFEVAFDADSDTLRPEAVEDSARTPGRVEAGTLPGLPFEGGDEPQTLPGVGASGTEPHLASATLAELYFNQGLVDRAADLYRQLVQREPGNEVIQARLVELEGIERHLRAGGPEAAGVDDGRRARRRALERTIARLEVLLAVVKRG